MFPTPEFSLEIPTPLIMFDLQRESPTDFIGEGPSVPLRCLETGDFDVDFDFLNNNGIRERSH